MITRKSTIKGKIVLTDKSTIELSDENIVKNTLYIENQCVNDNALEFGAAYSAECGFTLRTNVDRYMLFNAEITITHVVDGVDIPMGSFTVYDSNRAGEYVSIKALDHMTDFDTETLTEITATPYGIISELCRETHIDLANTEDEIRAMPNGARVFKIASADCTTLRTALQYICKMLCANAYIDTTGKLRLAQYETTPSITLERKDRARDCSISDFDTTFKGVKCRFLASQNYYTYTAIDADRRGIILDLGDIPIVNSSADIKNAELAAILEHIKGITYTPTEINVPAISGLRLGQMIRCKDINGGTDATNTLVMKYKWNYRQIETIDSYGENPRLQNITTKAEQQAQHSAASQASTNEQLKEELTGEIIKVAEGAKIDVQQLTNTDAVTISTTENVVATGKIFAYDDTTAIITIGIQLNYAAAGTLTANVYAGDTLLKTITQYCAAGNHYITATIFMAMAANGSSEITLKCKSTKSATCAAGDATIAIYGQNIGGN